MQPVGRKLPSPFVQVTVRIGEPMAFEQYAQDPPGKARDGAAMPADSRTSARLPIRIVFMRPLFAPGRAARSSRCRSTAIQRFR